LREQISTNALRVIASKNSASPAFYFIYWKEDGTVLASSTNAPPGIPRPKNLLGARPEPGRNNWGHLGPPPGKGFEVFPRTRSPLQEAYHFTPSGDCILVGRPLQPEYAALRQMAVWLVAAGGAVLVCGLAGGMWVATRAIRPIEDISATAVKIAAGDLSQRIDTAGTDNELGHLAALLNATFARLETAFGQQARFTSDASHELRTPVTVILTQTQTALSRERPAADYRGALEACQRAAQRMRKLIESLLELARLDAGQEPLKQERFDLSRVARDGVELVRPLAAEHGITIQCGLAPVECLGDSGRLGQVVVNLLSNAIQFNRDQGEILISAASHERTAVLTVADHGQGIPVADLPHIFERFYRVDKSRSRLQGRSGLGLAICKAIVEAHGGSLEVASQEGQGSTFTVKLPIP
jgi:heavy metal sensor kinase